MAIHEPDIKRLSSDLAQCQIYDMQVSLHLQSLYLMLSRSGNGPLYQVELSSVLRCRFSMSPSDNFLPAIIGSCELHIMHDIAAIEHHELILSNDVELAIREAFELDRNAYLLRIDGDLTLEVIALQIDILKSLPETTV